MKDFDPWNSTFEEAMAASQSSRTGDPLSPVAQFSAVERIRSLQEGIEDGNGFDVLDAVSQCALRGLVMPDWLANAYLSRYRTVLSCQAGSWDDAFGKPYRGKKLHNLRRRRNLRFGIYNRVCEIKRASPERAIGKELFESVGKEFATGTTLTEEMYYEAKKMLPKIPRKTKK